MRAVNAKSIKNCAGGALIASKSLRLLAPSRLEDCLCSVMQKQKQAPRQRAVQRPFLIDVYSSQSGLYILAI